MLLASCRGFPRRNTVTICSFDLVDHEAFHCLFAPCLCCPCSLAKPFVSLSNKAKILSLARRLEEMTTMETRPTMPQEEAVRIPWRLRAQDDWLLFGTVHEP